MTFPLIPRIGSVGLTTKRLLPVILTADVADGRRYQTRMPLMNAEEVDLSQIAIGAAVTAADLFRKRR